MVYGEMAASNYSGVGISCGSGLCNICLAVLSVPVISFSVPKAGDFIDAQAAQVTGERANRLRISKEKAFQLNGFTSDRVHNALTVYYQEVISNLIGSLRAHIASAQKLPKLEQSVPLVLSGGTAMPKGFLDHFIRILQSEEFPVAAVGSPGIRRPLAFDGARGADGRAVLAPVQPIRRPTIHQFLGAPRRFFWICQCGAGVHACSGSPDPPPDSQPTLGLRLAAMWGRPSFFVACPPAPPARAIS